MARSYAKLYVSIWTGEFRQLTGAAQNLYFLLVSNPKLSAAGAIVHEPRRWARQSVDATPEGIDHALAELERRRYILRDHDTDEVLIRSFIRHDKGYGNRFLRKNIESAITAIESDCLREFASRELTKAQVEDSKQGSDEDSYQGSEQDADEQTWQANNEQGTELQPHHHQTAGASIPAKPAATPAPMVVEPSIKNTIVLTAAGMLADREPAGKITSRSAWVHSVAQRLLRDHGDWIDQQPRKVEDPTFIAVQLANRASGTDPAADEKQAASGAGYGAAVLQAQHEGDMLDRDAFLREIEDRPQVWRDAAVVAYDASRAALSADEVPQAQIIQFEQRRQQ